MQLHPRESFTIVRQIEDHTDLGTYYVMAVVRNAKTDALLANVNLTDRGSRRFSESYIVPADPSGQGFYISVLTSVYTDSGYTTKSPSYGDVIETYLVQDRYNHNLGIGGGGGIDLTPKKLKSLIAAVLKEEVPGLVKIPKPAKPAEIPKVDIKTPLSALEAKLLEAIKAIDIPESPSLEPLIESLAKLSEAISSKHEEGIKLAKENLEEILRKITATGEINTEELKGYMKDIEVKVPDMEFTLSKKASKEKVGINQSRVNKLLS